MNKPVVLFGTGDFARVASVYLEQDSPHPVAAFTVHQAHLTATELLGKPVVPFENLQASHPPADYAMFVAVGYKGVNKARAGIYQTCKDRGYELITYVCSRAVRWGHVELGDNCFVFENNVLQPFVKIGNDVVLWSGNHIGHDATIGDHCFITSHVVVAGRANIGPYCFLGINATVRDGVTIGAESVIGAGALIVKDAAPQSVFKGPAGELSSVPSSRLKGI
jgi:sugar O-acyltransferase (sialic acid O-acetyltransferase NeuD family)